MVLRRCLESIKGVGAVQRRIDRADHSDVAVRVGKKLLAIKPERLRGVGDGEVPLRSIAGCEPRGDEDVSRVETACEGLTGCGKRRLGH